MTGAASDVAYLARALKAPRIPDAARTLATKARDESWDYEAYLAAVLTEEVSLAREPWRPGTGQACSLPPGQDAR